MQKKFRVTVDGHPYLVTVEDITEPSGMLYPAPGLSTHAVEPPPAAAATTASPASPAVPAANPGDEVSPLAGVVHELSVTVGQQVTAGQRIATIEAMKMKTAVVASRAGTVTAIAVQPGQAVDAGQALMTIG